MDTAAAVPAAALVAQSDRNAPANASTGGGGHEDATALVVRPATATKTMTMTIHPTSSFRGARMARLLAATQPGGVAGVAGGAGLTSGRLQAVGSGSGSYMYGSARKGQGTARSSGGGGSLLIEDDALRRSLVRSVSAALLPTLGGAMRHLKHTTGASQDVTTARSARLQPQAEGKLDSSRPHTAGAAAAATSAGAAATGATVAMAPRHAARALSKVGEGGESGDDSVDGSQLMLIADAAAGGFSPKTAASASGFAQRAFTSAAAGTGAGLAADGTDPRAAPVGASHAVAGMSAAAGTARGETHATAARPALVVKGANGSSATAGAAPAPAPGMAASAAAVPVTSPGSAAVPSLRLATLPRVASAKVIAIMHDAAGNPSKTGLMRIDGTLAKHAHYDDGDNDDHHDDKRQQLSCKSAWTACRRTCMTSCCCLCGESASMTGRLLLRFAWPFALLAAFYFCMWLFGAYAVAEASRFRGSTALIGDLRARVWQQHSAFTLLSYTAPGAAAPLLGLAGNALGGGWILPQNVSSYAACSPRLLLAGRAALTARADATARLQDFVVFGVEGAGTQLGAALRTAFQPPSAALTSPDAPVNRLSAFMAALRDADAALAESGSSSGSGSAGVSWSNISSRVRLPGVPDLPVSVVTDDDWLRQLLLRDACQLPGVPAQCPNFLGGLLRNGLHGALREHGLYMQRALLQQQLSTQAMQSAAVAASGTASFDAFAARFSQAAQSPFNSSAQLANALDVQLCPLPWLESGFPAGQGSSGYGIGSEDPEIPTGAAGTAAAASPAKLLADIRKLTLQYLDPALAAVQAHVLGRLLGDSGLQAFTTAVTVGGVLLLLLLVVCWLYLIRVALKRMDGDVKRTRAVLLLFPPAVLADVARSSGLVAVSTGSESIDE